MKDDTNGFISNNNIEIINNSKELEKGDKNFEPSKDITSISDSILSISANINFKIENIKIISSDVYCLGKSYKIKKMIGPLRYYHLPLGGKLTKNIIYKKISNLIKKIKKDHMIIISRIKKDIIEYKNIAIHIDLSESEEISIINEFLFSFLITKFYINNEDIIYIPEDLNIYIEIPNYLRENYLDKFAILNYFPIKNIVLGEVKQNKKKIIENIQMDKLPEKIRDIFKKTLGFEDKEKDEENKEI